MPPQKEINQNSAVPETPAVIPPVSSVPRDPATPISDNSGSKPEPITNLGPSMNSLKPEDSIVIKTIRTYEGDMQDAISKDNLSISKIMMAEKRKRSADSKDEENINPTSRKNLLIIGISIILLLAGLSIVAIVFVKNRPQISEPTQIIEETIIPADKTVSFTLSATANKNDLVSFINTEKAKGNKLGTLTHLAIMEQTTSTTTGELKTSTLFSILNSRAPSALTRNMSSKFMAGLYTADGTNLFLIIPVSSYSIAWSGMLEWERTMPDEIGNLFYDPTKIEKAPLNTTDDILKNPSGFKDGVLQNIDVRALYDKSGKRYFFYGFLDQNTIIMTTSEFALKEVYNRLRNIKFSR